MFKESLYHAGIKGMKWGVVKQRAEEASSFVKAGHAVNDSVEKMRNAKKSKAKASAMSDEELKKRVMRMNLEQQYSTLSSSQKSKGYTYTKNALEVAGGALAVVGSIASIAVAMKSLKE